MTYRSDPGSWRIDAPPDPADWLCDFCDDYHLIGEMPCAAEQQAFAEGPREYAHWCLEELFVTADEKTKHWINIRVDRLEECPEVIE